MPATPRSESFGDASVSGLRPGFAEKAFGYLPLLLFGSVAASIMAVHWLFPALLSRLSICGMQRVFGVPCPLCGGTRSFYALSNLDLVKALTLNPLVFLGAAAVSVWFTAWVVDRVFKTRFSTAVQRRLFTTTVGKALIGLCLLNWIYLLFWLPK